MMDKCYCHAETREREEHHLQFWFHSAECLDVYLKEINRAYLLRARIEEQKKELQAKQEAQIPVHW
jgi:hypothetical protein